MKENSSHVTRALNRLDVLISQDIPFSLWILIDYFQADHRQRSQEDAHRRHALQRSDLHHKNCVFNALTSPNGYESDSSYIIKKKDTKTGKQLEQQQQHFVYKSHLCNSLFSLQSQVQLQGQPIVPFKGATWTYPSRVSRSLRPLLEHIKVRHCLLLRPFWGTTCPSRVLFCCTKPHTSFIRVTGSILCRLPNSILFFSFSQRNSVSWVCLCVFLHNQLNCTWSWTKKLNILLSLSLSLLQQICMKYYTITHNLQENAHKNAFLFTIQDTKCLHKDAHQNTSKLFVLNCSGTRFKGGGERSHPTSSTLSFCTIGYLF